MDLTKLDEAVTKSTFNVTLLEPNGYVLTNEALCKINTLVILKHMASVYCDCQPFTDRQSENIMSLYNHLVD